ncbi:DODA-type extradiol aromatic ring-opening family dioxygenase [Sphingomonas montana]|uniref:DODA-type extradiol aromatic ring-opening family dioxygenase n=1 Tax=Sphingomonas montana TaxID=1843236 RepID=UPI00096D0BA0|nr:class III extradiol ring-cleavage dioxygenase [Sphingomonas montana]
MQPTFFINHGGGPCFFLEPGPIRDTWRELETYLRGFIAGLAEQPRAILAVSGHWEERVPTVNAAAHPPLLFDYGGFPDHTYRLTWPAPGALSVAARVHELLSVAGIAIGKETARGWDHGIFVPFKVMVPGADIPLVQLSLQHGLDPAGHLAIGRALRPLRDEEVLIVGSGQSYHNMRGFFGRVGVDKKAEAFDAWLRSAMIDGGTRDRALIRWEEAPHARDAQLHEDHLLPLMIAAGAASGEPGTVHFHGHALGKPISGFRFG